jgi:hypothetical protein
MKITKGILRVWFGIVSVATFLLGWGMLAHSLKPIQPASGQSVQNNLNLPPIQAFGQDSSSSSLFSINGDTSLSGSGFPMLRTRGS